MTECLQIIANLNLSGGGPSRSVTSLCDALAASGLSISLASQKSMHENNDDLLLPHDQRVDVLTCDAYKLLRTIFTPFYDRHISYLVEQKNINLIHSHGIWLQCNRVAASVSRKQNIPHIVSPRGMLEPWAFNYRYWKKFPFWHMWQHQALLDASLFCATASQEADSIRALGFHQPIAVIPNGVDIPELPEKDCAVVETKTALFLSRIHPKKGVKELVDAWSRVRPDGWRCVIAGPDEEGHESVIKQAVLNAGLEKQFEFVGPVYGEGKASLMNSADLFILPTYTENFGIAIAEALAYGIPVITTKGAPWECLVSNNCGWWVDIGVDPLEGAMREAFTLSRETLSDMGRRGRVLMEREYSWQSAAQSMKTVYEWVLCGGTVPDCVRLD